MMAFKVIVLCCAVLGLVNEISGHGMMLQPAQRSSIWRFDSSAPANYDDNQLYCGGLSVQTSLGGKCGVCGDQYNSPHPQENENTGKYGQGQVVEKYTKGSVIDTNILLTTNHLGKFRYSLCILNDPNAPESGDDCFVPLKLEDGSDAYSVTKSEKEIKNRVQLPNDVVCERCVLRWWYTAGNNWGQCDDGTYAQGCGPQETFVNCADISIS